MSLPGNRNINSWSGVNKEVERIYHQISKLESMGGTKTTILSGGSIRSDSKVLSAGTTYVQFSGDIGTAIYHLIIEIYSTDGTLMPQSTISSNIPQTSAGFTITVNEASIIKYTAVPPT